MHLSQKKFDALMLGSGLVTSDDISLARLEAERTGRGVGDTLIALGKIDERHFSEILQGYYTYPIVDLKKKTITLDQVTMLPEAYMKGKRVVVVAIDDEKGALTLGMVDPSDYEAIEYVEKKLGHFVEPAIITPSSLSYALKKYKKEIGLTFDASVEENIKQALAGGKTADAKTNAQSVPVSAVLDAVLEHAAAFNASDIHFEPLENSFVIRFRVDGLMQEIASFPKEVAAPLTARVKILAGMQIDEHRAPQDGRFRATADETSVVDIRVNIMPIFHGEKVEMRLLKSSNRPIMLRDLGLSPKQEAILVEEAHKPHGMILVTGPTGHGKTTTLYALLHVLNTPKVNITTIEDPVEYEFPRVNQTQVNVKAGITFANGLRSLLRQNPDIIMVGEIRDDETADISIHAALTGHLLLSSLHTNDAPSALPRLVDMGAEPFLLSSTVNAVVAQRLVRRICPSCIYSYSVSPDITKAIKDQIKVLGDKHIKTVPKTLYKGKGCPACGGSGFVGQVGIFEILQMTEAVRDILLAHSPASKIRTQAVKEGMITMFEDGLQKVEQGATTIEEVLRVVRE